MLLDELITLLSDPKQSLSEALYKTKVLFHQLGRKDLVPWVTHEIAGYPDESEVPPYRLIGAQVRCNLMNAGWTNNNQLLIIGHLDAVEQKAITEIKLRFPIEVIQESIRKYSENSSNRMVSNIAPETFGRFNQVITNGGRLTAAWSELNMGDVAGVLSSVRSRLLDFVLELKDQIDTAQVSVIPDAGLPERLEKAGINPGDIFKNAVFTDSTINLMIGSGVQNVNIKNKPGDIKSLLEVLRKKGVLEEDLIDLEAAVTEDGEAGEVTVDKGKTQSWLLKTAAKAGKGAMKIGTKVFTEVAIAAIEHYANV
jgi:hypothetical protein